MSKKTVFPAIVAFGDISFAWPAFLGSTAKSYHAKAGNIAIADGKVSITKNGEFFFSKRYQTQVDTANAEIAESGYSMRKIGGIAYPVKEISGGHVVYPIGSGKIGQAAFAYALSQLSMSTSK